MIKNNFYPLRSIVGSSVPIKSIILSSTLPDNYKVISIPNPSEGFEPQTLEDKILIEAPGIGNVYRKFLPGVHKNGITNIPMDGMGVMPIPNTINLPIDFFGSPSNFPFSFASTVGSIFGFKTLGFQKHDINIRADNNFQGINNPFLSNTDNEFSFVVTLEQEALIGGMCFNGYPYITSRIETGDMGMTLGNFGLPREIRLTPLSSNQQRQFIDSEFVYTRQEIISHSGLNYMSIDPVKTNRFLLTITDLPFIINNIDLDASSIESDGNIKLRIEGFKGFAIPYIYFFEYKESTHKKAWLNSGVIGIKSEAVPLDESKNPDLLKIAFPEYEFYSSEKSYSLFTAHSALGQKRKFQIAPASGLFTEFVEMFISDVLKPGQKVILYLQQGEEFERCVAGLKMLLPMFPEDTESQKQAEHLSAMVNNSTVLDNHLTPDERKAAEKVLTLLFRVPGAVNFCEKVRIRIFELDPIEGVSPASVELNSKYATVLVDTKIDDFLDVEINNGIPFNKVSSSKYFAVELTNAGKEEGQIAIYSMHLVRSAHVSVQTRAAKTQQVKALHYRLIGPELADDFSKLGNEGFNFSIDRVVAGQTKNVLYSAMSLLDLLHTGGARIQSNVRRRASEFEMVTNYREKEGAEMYSEIKRFQGDNFSGANFENRETDNDNKSWRSIESGSDVVWPLDKGDPGVPFESFSGSEIRSRTEQISAIFKDTGGDFLNELIKQFNKLKDSTGVEIELLDIKQASDKLFIDEGNTGIWKPFEKFNFDEEDLPSLPGFQVLNVPPFFLALQDTLEDIAGVMKNIDRPERLPEKIADLFNNSDDAMAKSVFSLLNGLGISISFGGVSISLNSNLSGSFRSSTTGAAGTIVQTGQELKHSLNRSMQQGFDNNISLIEMNEAELKRIITRRELLGRDTERIRGAEVMWQDKIQDIITGSIPLNFTLPATATKLNFRTADDTLRVRFNSGFSSSIEVDFWFELIEETIKDDY